MSAALPFDDSTHAQPWPLPDKNVHPVFAGILQAIEAQPAMLERAAAKADGRRFTGEPLTGFGELPVEFQAEVEPKLGDATLDAIRLIRELGADASHAELKALMASIGWIVGEAYRAGRPDMGAVSDHLDAAILAMDDFGVDDSDVQRSRERQATRGLP